jgi:cytochrome P450
MSFRVGATAPMQTLTDLPGPKGLPLLGNLLQLDLKQLHRVLERWTDEFGALYKFQLGQRPVLVVSDPELNQTILRNRPKIYARLGTIEPVFKEMGITGVFSAEGEDWKRQRRLTSHALDTSHLREFFPTLIKVTERLRNRWNRAAEKRAAIDVQQDLMRYTVDVTTNLAFGYDMNTLENEGDIIQEHLEKIFPMINRRINAPFPYWRYFKLPTDRALDRSLAAIRETISGFVARGRERLAQNPDLAKHPTNLLEAMLGAVDEGDAAFTDEEIYGNVLTMLLAGEDTTANTMAWMIHFMIEHPEVQARMQAEARGVVGSGGILRQLADAETLKYIEAVAHETMRLKPVAPVLFLESLQDVEIGGVAVPKQTAVFLLTMHGALQNDHFGRAEEFRPERWLEAAPSAGCPHNARAFVPFGAGPRFCPGRQLALVEIKTVMAMLCSSFEVLKPEKSHPVTELFSFTMMPQNLSVQMNSQRDLFENSSASI